VQHVFQGLTTRFMRDALGVVDAGVVMCLGHDVAPQSDDII
jgi:hypothetical protein